MTLGISLALTLGAGLYADSGPTVLKRRFEAAWGKTEVFVANATAWELARERTWQHAESWSIRFAQNLQSPYGLRLEGGTLRRRASGEAALPPPVPEVQEEQLQESPGPEGGA